MVPSYLGKKYPDVTKSAAKKKFKELKGKELEEYGMSLPFDAKKELLVEGLKSKDVNVVRACAGAFRILALERPDGVRRCRSGVLHRQYIPPLPRLHGQRPGHA